MVHSVLKHLGRIQQYGIVSLCLFCSVFVGVLVWTLLQKKSHLDYMARLALDDEPEESQSGNHSHE
jgi:cbb3-type cytochrome oxidase subunit 3